MNIIDMQAIRTTFDGRSQVWDVMTSLKSAKKRRHTFHARDVRGLTGFSFYPLEEQIANKSSIFRCKLCLHPFQDPTNTLSCSKATLKPLVEKLKFSTYVAKSDLRFKDH